MALTKATQNVIAPEIVTTNTTQTITGTKTFTATIVGNTATSTKLITARTINGIAFDGTADITIPASGSSSAKAWVNFNGTTSPGTIRSSFNVSSVTRDAQGKYTVNFTTAMSNTNYAVVVGANETSSSTDAGSNHRAWASTYASSTTSASVLFVSYAATFIDADTISVAIFGN